MARKNPARLEFDALSIEGGLFPAEWLAKVAATEASAQTPADYGVPKGLALRDEIGRYWRIAQALWRDFDLARGTTAGAEGLLASRAFLRQFLRDVLGFTDLTDGSVHETDGRRFTPGFEGLGGRVPIFVGAPAEGLDDSVSRHGDDHRRRSAFGALQEYLNATETALWGLAGNGPTLRLVRDNASLTRPAWVEADLARVFAEERYADFAAFWLLAHASRFGRTDAPASDCVLEQWRGECQQQGSRAREALREGVEAAILALGQGFLAHPANRPLRQSLADGSLTREAYFNELLRCVYRMIFLLTIEERELLFRPDASDDAKRLYAEGYGMRRLRERAVRRSQHDRHGDLWASLRPVFTALGQAEGEPTLGLPGLGGLFAHDQCPHLDDAALDNRALLGAVYRLAWLREQQSGTLARVNWKDMGPEELGSVYESLLELVPMVSDDGRRFSFAGSGESAGNARKLSGSYYTPDALVQQLLDTALEPVVAQRLAECDSTDRKEEALLSLSVVDPACGSGHFLLAAARRLAGHLARQRVGGTPGASEYRHALRDVVTHCIHGVDRNPMAVELARMALWLEAYTPDKALGFVDHHLVCGDALLGLLDLNLLRQGIPDEAFKAIDGDDKDVARTLGKLNRAARKELQALSQRGQLALSLGAKTMAEAFAELDALTDDAVTGVVAKRAQWAKLREEAEGSPMKLASDIFLAAFLVPKRLLKQEHALTEQQAAGRFPSTATVAMAIEGTLKASHSVAAVARTVCRDNLVFHWPIAFPQVFSRGGFDVVLGNPPWEQLEVDESMSFEEQARASRTQLFLTSSGRFPLTGSGRKNLYALFVESVLGLLNHSGRAGVVVPTGIVTDQPSEEICRFIVTECRLLSLFDFENQGRHFEAVHRQQRFALVTLAGAPSNHGPPTYGFDLGDVHDVNEPGRSWTLQASEVARMSPARFSLPMFRTSKDATLTSALYRNGITIKDLEGSEFWIGSGLLYNADAKSKSLRRLYADVRTDRGFAKDFVRVYEGTYFHAFDHRYAYATGRSIESSTDSQRSDPRWEPWTEFVMPLEALERWVELCGSTPGWYIAMRRQARVSDGMTGIATVLPISVAEGNTSVFWGPGAVGSRGAILCACLNSLAFNYALRIRQSGANVSKSIYEQIPLAPFWQAAPGEDAYSAVVHLAAQLCYTSNSLRSFAEDVGEAVLSPWNPEQRHALRCQLEAYVFAQYGLGREQVDSILSTFPVLMRREEHEFGEYRTRRLILREWDRLFG